MERQVFQVPNITLKGAESLLCCVEHSPIVGLQREEGRKPIAIDGQLLVNMTDAQVQPEDLTHDFFAKIKGCRRVPDKSLANAVAFKAAEFSLLSPELTEPFTFLLLLSGWP